mmetsp:Transcript_14892/g.37471  ORF Transcript_14892/g.37471 Transcript_14892/m.37471 type:complete len:305 (-) Transcript_14892:494-1408(-)
MARRCSDAAKVEARCIKHTTATRQAEDNSTRMPSPWTELKTTLVDDRPTSSGRTDPRALPAGSTSLFVSLLPLWATAPPVGLTIHRPVCARAGSAARRRSVAATAAATGIRHASTRRQADEEMAQRNKISNSSTDSSARRSSGRAGVAGRRRTRSRTKWRSGAATGEDTPSKDATANKVADTWLGQRSQISRINTASNTWHICWRDGADGSWRQSASTRWRSGAAAGAARSIKEATTSIEAEVSTGHRRSMSKIVTKTRACVRALRAGASGSRRRSARARRRSGAAEAEVKNMRDEITSSNADM